jgi:hypothetical protein
VARITELADFPSSHLRHVFGTRYVRYLVLILATGCSGSPALFLLDLLRRTAPWLLSSPILVNYGYSGIVQEDNILVCLKHVKEGVVRWDTMSYTDDYP